MKVDPRGRHADVAARLKRIGNNPGADELAGVMAELRGAPRAALEPLAQAVERSLERTLTTAFTVKQVDLLAVHAESAGKLVAMQRALVDAPTNCPMPPSALEKRAGELMNRVVDLRIEGLRRLAAPTSRGAAATAIRDSEREGASLQGDLARLRRYGFEPRQVDVEALLFAVKRAAVDAFVG